MDLVWKRLTLVRKLNQVLKDQIRIFGNRYAFHPSNSALTPRPGPISLGVLAGHFNVLNGSGQVPFKHSIVVQVIEKLWRGCDVNVFFNLHDHFWEMCYEEWLGNIVALRKIGIYCCHQAQMIRPRMDVLQPLLRR